jgi:hypothetical protein
MHVLELIAVVLIAGGFLALCGAIDSLRNRVSVLEDKTKILNEFNTRLNRLDGGVDNSEERARALEGSNRD